MVSNYSDEDISPASINVNPKIVWSEESKPNTTNIIDGECSVCVWTNSGNFKFARSEQEFSSGNNRVEIQVDWKDKEAQISYGVCWDQNFNKNCGLYYFTNSYLYCNYYPCFTKNMVQIHTTPPPRAKNLSKIAVNFDFEEHQIWWEIDDVECEKLKFEPTNPSVFIVCSVFDGEVSII